MPSDTLGVEIDRPRCLALLEHASLGHLGFTRGALPVIVPVDFAVIPASDGPLGGTTTDEPAVDELILRLPAGPGVDQSLRRQVACLQAEQLDLQTGSGWSVVVTGPTRLVNDPEEVERLADLRMGSWARSGGEDRYVSVRADLVNGRWLRAR